MISYTLPRRITTISVIISQHTRSVTFQRTQWFYSLYSNQNKSRLVDFVDDDQLDFNPRTSSFVKSTFLLFTFSISQLLSDALKRRNFLAAYRENDSVSKALLSSLSDSFPASSHINSSIGQDSFNCCTIVLAYNNSQPIR